MAGESPGKSERERSSGETAEDTGAVPPVPPRDPRESYVTPPAGNAGDPGDPGAGKEPRSPESQQGAEEPVATGENGDARLRDAVAAWVSGPEPEEATEDEGTKGGDAADADDVRAPGGGGEAATADAPSDLPVRPRGAASTGAAASDTPTTMFGAVRREEATSGKESAAARAERLTTAFFGSSRKPDAPGEPGDAEKADEESGTAPTAPAGGEGRREAAEPGGHGPEEAHGSTGAGAGDARRGGGGDARGRTHRDRASKGAAVADGGASRDAEEASTGRSDSGPAEGGGTGTAPSGDDDDGGSAVPDGRSSARAGKPVTRAAGRGGEEGTGASGTAARPAATRRSAAPDTPEDGAEDRGTAVLRGGGTPAKAGPTGMAGRTDQPTTALRRREDDAVGPAPDDGPPGDGPPGGGTPGEGGRGEGGGDAAPRSGPVTAAAATGSAEAGPARPGPREAGTAEGSEGGPGAAGAADAAARTEPGKAKPERPETSEDAPGTQGAGGPGAGAREAPEEAGGASRFVPLRSADTYRTPGTPPAGPRTAGTRTAGTETIGVGGEQERTKQQPVPDPPPLELLAQLTNTPPPPETPLRTAVRRVKIWTPLAVLLAIVFVIVQAVRPLPEPELTLTTDETHTFDGGKPSLPWPTEGQTYVEVAGIGVLGSSGEQRPVPIGSVAKTMTAYVVLKENPLKEGEDGPTITVDELAEQGGKRGAGNGDESVLDGVKEGDKLSLRQAIAALMIPSANNVARLLARWDSGSEAAFVEKMNRTAEDLGMENTTYTDPSGLKETTVSTAADQVELGKRAAQLPELMSITKLPSWKNPFTGQQMRNWNTLVPYDGAVGIKTGTTTAAGGNLLFAGRKDVGGTRQLIVGAVLGQHTPPIIDTANAVSRDLLLAAGNTLTSETIVRKGDVVGYLDDGLGGRTPVVATEDVRAIGYGGVRVGLSLEAGDGAMPHSAPAGREVGVLTVGGGPGRVEVPVALGEDLTEPGFGDKLTRIL